jgi:phosphoglycolate phosphatase-like HAD superfamily hydrolase
MPIRPTVVLFDIDGTLITCGGAGRRAMERALREIAPHATTDFSFGGMTDPAIVRRALRQNTRVRESHEPPESAADKEALIDRALERYLDLLSDELPRSEGYAVLPGVRRAIEALERERDAGAPIAIGLGTGNLVRGAELKLRPADLWHRFDFGGFGSDDEDRPTLLRHGATRGAQRLGAPADAFVTVVIGDTPRDVQAARAIGSRCLAVATGSYAREDLAAERPDHVLDTLLELELSHVLG